MKAASGLNDNIFIGSLGALLMRFFRMILIVRAGILVCLTAGQAFGSTMDRQPSASSDYLETGDYLWQPETSPTGPVVIIVSLSDQILCVYRNGICIGRSSISSGKAGFGTPVGLFTILQKRATHTSNLFRGGSMPYMERLTWKGVAMHAGSLPGYADSHGCVRMPLDFARKLYRITENGTTVIVTDHRFRSYESQVPALLFDSQTGGSLPAGLTYWDPAKSPNGPLSIVVSSGSSEVFVYRNGMEIGRTPIGGLDGLSGLYVYSALAEVDAGGRRSWLSTGSIVGRAPQIRELVKHVSINQQFIALTRGLIEMGTTLILTDAPVNSCEPNAPPLDILTTETSQ